MQRDFADRLRAWTLDDRPPTTVHSSLAATLHHFTTFWSERRWPNVALFHYADLEDDLEREIKTLAETIGLTLPGSSLADLVAAARFDAMRQQPWIAKALDHVGSLPPKAPKTPKAKR